MARLAYCASHFPLVEVDSTYYAPPSEANARRWAKRTPGVSFNLKAYALLTHHPADAHCLKALLPPEAQEGGRVYLRFLPTEARELLCTQHEKALRPLVQAGRLGAVSWTSRRAQVRDAADGRGDGFPGGDPLPRPECGDRGRVRSC